MTTAIRKHDTSHTIIEDISAREENVINDIKGSQKSKGYIIGHFENLD